MLPRDGGGMWLLGTSGRVAMAGCEGKGRIQEHTSWDHPHTTFGDRELVHLAFAASTCTSILLPRRRADRHQNLALVHEEDHLHLARVLRPLEAVWWQLDNSGAEEGKRHYFSILESRLSHVAGHDR
jgi:hypothetical protein